MQQISGEKEMEMVGDITLKFFKLTPLWAPVALAGFYYLKPELFHQIFSPYYPAAKKIILMIITTLILTTVFLILRFIFNRYREGKNYQYYRIIPHQEQHTRTDAIHEMIQQIAGYKRPRYMRWAKGREWFKWLIHHDENGIAFYIGFPQDRKTGILRTIKNAYSEAEFHEVKKVEIPGFTAYSGRMVMEMKGRHEVKPLASFSGKNGIGNMISYMETGTWIDISFSPSSPFLLMRKIRKAQKKMKQFHQKMSDMDSFDKADLKAVSKRLTGRDKVFNVAVSIASESQQAGGVVHSIATTMGSIMNDENGLVLRRMKNAVEYSPYPFRYKMDWVGRELANLLLLPHPEHDINEKVPHLKQGERALAPNELAEGVTIGYMKHPIVEQREVKIPYKVLSQHFFISGKTGSGKSSQILMINQSLIDDWLKDHTKNPGFTLFDPAKETALTVLSRLKKAEKEGHEVPWEKVHYISLTNDTFPFGLNLLHKEKDELNDTVKNNIMAILDTAFQNEGAPKARKWIEFAILALLEDKTRKHSILGVNRMFKDEKFRESVIQNIKDPLLKQEWETYALKEGDATLDAIGTRMAPFQSSMYMRRMFGQTQFGLNIRKWMDEGHIVLIDMLGVDDINIAMTVGHMITQYHQTAIKRITGAKLHVLMVDEAHLAQIPIMDTIIAFDRKFGLSLGIITQYMNQLQKFLRSAIKGNIGTILSGTQGDESAAQIESMTFGKFTADDVMKLPSNTSAVFTQEKVGNANKIVTCTVTTDPPYVYKEDGEKSNHLDEIEMKKTFKWLEEIALSLQKRDGEHYADVDKKITAYLGIGETKNREKASLFSEDTKKDLIRGDAEQQENQQKMPEVDRFSPNQPHRQDESEIMENSEKVAKRELIQETENENKLKDQGGVKRKKASLF